MDLFRSIVVPTDFSPLSEAAVARAMTFARLNGASVHLVHAQVFPFVAGSRGAHFPPAMLEKLRVASREKMKETQTAIERRGIQRVTADLAPLCTAVEAISTAVETYSADLIVMGTHGHSGCKLAYLGSVAERTLRTVDCPVLAVKEDVASIEEPIKRILLPVDFSVHSDRAVESAMELAKLFGASVDVIHAFNVPWDYSPFASTFRMQFEKQIQEGASEMLDSVRERFEKSEVPVTLHIRCGYPSVVISEAAEEIGCQLIVMGTRGNSGLSHVLLGSVAERTLRTAPCSVLAVKVEGSQEDE
jgi:nucleotide-binding universal stress UspA family protein